MSSLCLRERASKAGHVVPLPYGICIRIELLSAVHHTSRKTQCEYNLFERAETFFICEAGRLQRQAERQAQDRTGTP